MKRAVAIAFALAVVTVGAVVAAATPEVHVPDGFVDLTKPMDAPIEARLAPYVANEAKNGGHLAYAFDFGRSSDGITANMIADVRKGFLRVDPAKLSDLVSEFVAGAKQAAPGVGPEVIGAVPVNVGRFMGVRIALDVTYGELRGRELVYGLPLGPDTLVLTYTASRDSFARYEPMFDASALSTSGLEAPPPAVAWSAITAGVLGIVGGLFVAVRSKARKKNESAGSEAPGM